MATSGGGFAASGLLQGFAQAYNAAYQRRTSQDLEQRHQLASFLISSLPNMRPEAQQDAANRLLQIYSTPVGKKLDKKLGDFSTLGAGATQQQAQAGQQGATASQTGLQQGMVAPPPPQGSAPTPGAPPQRGGEIGAPQPQFAGAIPQQAPGIPAPPPYSPLLSPEEHRQRQAADIMSAKQAELHAEMQARHEEAKAIGLKEGTPQFENFVAGRMLTPFGRQQQEWFVDQQGKQRALNHDNVTGLYTDPTTQEVVDTTGMAKWSAGQAVPKKILYSDPSNPTHKLIGFQTGTLLTDQSNQPLPVGTYLIDDGLVPKTVVATTPKVDANGQYQNFTETHTTTPNIPGVGGGAKTSGIPAPPGAAPKAAETPKSTGTSKGIPKSNVTPVTGQGGQPVYAPAANKWAMWTNPDTGQQEAGPLSMAPPGSNPATVGAQEQRDNINARHAVNLMTKVGDPKHPETMGVLQLIDALDKEDKLGVMASRWNAFKTKGIGAAPDDDPRIVALINKNMLADTAAMLAHFGASGGRSPQMLQHFIDLADAGKMDAATLKAGTLAIADYMKDRAMIPASNGNIPSPPGTGGQKTRPPLSNFERP